VVDVERDAETIGWPVGAGGRWCDRVCGLQRHATTTSAGVTTEITSAIDTTTDHVSIPITTAAFVAVVIAAATAATAATAIATTAGVYVAAAWHISRDGVGNCMVGAG
jgi:hypothetical protein